MILPLALEPQSPRSLLTSSLAHSTEWIVLCVEESVYVYVCV